MYKDTTIAVVVPCYNEEKLVTQVLDTMPDFVDRIYVIDDLSADQTIAVVEAYISATAREDITLIQHDSNQGVGAAIISGYLRAAAEDNQVVAVMAGDAQMAPDELESIIAPVVSGEADYTKGNRLASGEAWTIVPRTRYIGNVILSLLTKIASGYWHIFDSQTGYTAISKQVIETLNWDMIWRRYGYPNHLLIMLNVHNFRVLDIPVRPIYNIGEQSNMRVWRVAATIWRLLLRGFLYRLFHKYVVRDAHPLVLFYLFGALTFFPGVALGLFLIFRRIMVGPVSPTSVLFSAFLVLFGINFLMFALWFDMDYGRRLR